MQGLFRSEKSQNRIMAIIVLITVAFVVLKYNKIPGHHACYFAVVALLLFEDENYLFYTMLMFCPLYSYMVYGSFPIFNVNIVLILIRRLLSKELKISLSDLSFIFYYIAVEVFGFVIVRKSPGMDFIKYIMILTVCMLQLYYPDKNYDNKKANLGLIMGSLLYCGATLITQNTTLLMDGSRVFGMGNVNANEYALYATIGMVFSIYVAWNTKGISFIRRAIFIGAASVIFLGGFMAGSKTFLFVSTGTLAFYILFGKKKASTYAIVGIVLIAAWIYISTTDIFLNGWELVNNRLEHRQTLSEFTTGRSDIAFDYLNQFKSEPLNIIFGLGNKSFRYYQGYYSNVKQLVRNGKMMAEATHNIFIEMIASWGIVGSILLVKYLIKGAKTYRRKMNITTPVGIPNCIPLVVVMAFLMSLAFWDHDIMFPILTCLIITAADVYEKEKVF